MKSNLEILHQQAMDLISVLAKKGDAITISRVAPIAKRVQQLKEELSHIEDETIRIKESLTGLSEAEPKLDVFAVSDLDNSDGKKRLRIQVDWSRLEKGGGKEIIFEHKSSETMAKWLGRLYQQFGIQVLHRLSNFRINRGPMVSKHPAVDFINRQSGRPYSHQIILDSDYYALTHSQTVQKVGDVRKACQFLGFPLGAIIADEVEK